MTYRIEISPTAIADIEKIFLWYRDYSVDEAHRWVRGCYEMMLKLEKFPNRCSLARESPYLNLPIRQLLYQKQYRVLFAVRTAEPENIVQIHRVLRASQARLDKTEQLFGKSEEE
ncbi:MAG: type II toxin-antitoxin system RelE/ParE family toxin [Limnothrix sp. RL_2_0]|nr:type II toxin-antitoxin system RelE/ParE family toxin [Limnothrix sp. RL_2_0]